jgi:co-chaperonin GroES (HSP10)
MKPAHHPNVPAELASVKPLGDFVLVRRLSEVESHRLEGCSPVYGPQWRNKGVEGTKYGEVMAVGPGDQMLGLYCMNTPDCSGYVTRLVKTHMNPGGAYSWSINRECPKCGNEMTLGEKTFADMPVKVGDIVAYHRAPANNTVIDGEEYVFCHAEQHVLAVIEKEP